MSTPKIGFWRIFWPTLVSSLILSVIGWIFWLIVFSSLFSTEEKVENRTVLHMKLDQEVTEMSNTSFDQGSFSMNRQLGISDVIHGLKKAKDDKEVKGIYLELGNVSMGYAKAKEIRDAISDFQSSGKFVVAYLNGEFISQKQYYIASVAKEIYGFPTSTVEFMGLGAEIMFLKGMFDRYGVEMQVIRGSNNDFKSAVEPYFRDNMSDSSRLQSNRFLSSMWEDIRSEIATSRKMTAQQLFDIAENVKVQRMEDALKYKFIDGLKYSDEVEALVSKKAKLDDLSDIESFEKYAKKKFKLEQQLLSNEGGANVAVIVADGAITVDGEEIASRKLCSYFREARNDDDIKVVVFRVNSPGGSALASEEIWREVMLTEKTKKVIVSMGDYAASGGYYISAPATTIFAENTTITGSIGVFGVIPFTGDLFQKNFGITFDRVQTNKHSVLSLNKRLTEEELSMIQGEVDKTYLQFKKRVADGRGMTVEQVQKIARGRVWSGKDAVKIGLVDKIGGFEDALAYAIKEAKIKTPTVRYYPKVKENKWEEAIETLSEEEETIQFKSSKLPKIANDLIKVLEKIESWRGIQMRLPVEMEIN